MRSSFGADASFVGGGELNGADTAARPTAFLDRDGTINIDTGYVRDASSVSLLPNAPEGLLRLAAQGFRLIVVSNQSGIARGLMSSDEVDAVNARLDALLRAHGVEVAGWFYCPHLPGDCRCRKPGPGLVEEADLPFPSVRDLSVVIGDKQSDVAVAETAHLGRGGIRIGDRAHLSSTEDSALSQPRHEIASDLVEAARIIERMVREQP